MTDEKAHVVLGEHGARAGHFTWGFTERPSGHHWIVAGDFRYNAGLEITSLRIEPDTSNPDAPPPGSQVVNSSTLKSLQFHPLRMAIADQLTRLQPIAERQIEAHSKLPEPDDHWDRVAAKQESQAWKDLNEQLDQAGAQARRRTKGGRPPLERSKWAKRAQEALEAYKHSYGRVYLELATRWKLEPETVHVHLRRMRKPPNDLDNGTGWLEGKRSSTAPGPRLRDWLRRQGSAP